MIIYQPTLNLSKSAELTYSNMHSYYEYFSASWDQSKILEQIIDLDNWDILKNGKIIGVIRLSYDGDECWLRDLQINENFQNNGVGGKALKKSKNFALKSGAKCIKLKVFKISPAYRLYERYGFKISNEDERFYYMEQKIA